MTSRPFHPDSSEALAVDSAANSADNGPHIPAVTFVDKLQQDDDLKAIQAFMESGNEAPIGGGLNLTVENARWYFDPSHQAFCMKVRGAQEGELLQKLADAGLKHDNFIVYPEIGYRKLELHPETLTHHPRYEKFRAAYDERAAQHSGWEFGG